MNKRTEKISVGILLFISILVFFAFGLFHLGKFETTDEHLWKYGRIKQYWQAIGNQDWKETYINDKPGVTIALFSGAGLLFEPNPENFKDISFKEESQRTFLKIFKVSEVEFINLIFRLPILILATISLFLFFWLGWKAFDSLRLALFSVMFLALNPILIGITQIINPDSYLWIFGGLAIFSYLAFLNKKERKFLLLTGLFTGLAILSKYTALFLFVFYFLAFVSREIFLNDKEKINFRFVFKEFLNLLLVLLIAIVLFCIFVPAVFVNPSYLTKGVAQFFERGNLSALIVPAVLIFGVAVFFRKKMANFLSAFIIKNRRGMLVLVCSVFLFIVAISLINVWSGQKLIPFDELRDASYANEPKKFYFGKEFKDLGFLEKNSKLFLLESYPFIFSLTPLFFFLILFVVVKSMMGKAKKQTEAIVFSVVSLAVLYFLMTLLIRVVANVRYSITLQFVFALLLAMALSELFGSLKIKKTKQQIILTALVLSVGAGFLWFSRPFYFSYESPLLPKKFTINSSWGSGFYEAAEYLNSKPNAEKMLIWSNSATICPFFKGKCLDSRKINTNIAKPDYFVVSKRGVIKERNRFIFINSDYQGKPSNWYFDNLENNYEWALFIGGRQENYVKIIKFEQ